MSGQLGYIEDPLLTKGSMFRIFVQEDGGAPSNPFYFHGDVSLGGLTESQGDITPTFAPSPSQRGQWIVVGYTRGEKSLPSADLTARMKNSLRQVWWDLRERGCPVNIHVLIGVCESPDDFYSWTSKMVFRSSFLTEITFPQFNPLSGGQEVIGDITGSLTMLGMSRLLPISFEEKADTTILARVVDGFYGNLVSCGSCGQADNGCETFYALSVSNAGSPGLSAQVVYTRDDFSTFTSRDVTTLGGLSASKLLKMGRYLVVFSAASNSHHAIPFTDLHAGDLSKWRAASGGYVAGATVNDVYGLTSNLAFIAAEDGYIYKLTNPTAGVTVVADGSATVEDLNAIDGKGNTIVVGGDNGVVMLSTNRGASFSLTSIVVNGVTITKNITAVGVIDPYKWFVGTSDGYVYYTENLGEWYLEQTDLPDDLTAIDDIVFVDDLVGYITARRGGIATVFRTDTIGNTWSEDAPYVRNIPTAQQFNFAAPCGYNSVVVGGVVSGNDGILARGA